LKIYDFVVVGDSGEILYLEADDKLQEVSYKNIDDAVEVALFHIREGSTKKAYIHQLAPTIIVIDKKEVTEDKPRPQPEPDIVPVKTKNAIVFNEDHSEKEEKSVVSEDEADHWDDCECERCEWERDPDYCDCPIYELDRADARRRDWPTYR
jgi:hypothetical protein